MQPALRLCNGFSSAGNRIGIAIETQNTRVLGCEQGPRITACAKCTVEIGAAGTRGKSREDLFEEHGHVPGRSACGESFVFAAARTHSRAPRGIG